MDGPGGGEVAVDCRPGGGVAKKPVVLDIQCRNIHGKLNINSGGFGGRLHWAVLRPDGGWEKPSLQPDGSQDCDDVASSAGLNKDGNVCMSFRPGHVPDRIAFCVVIQCQGQTHWIKQDNGDNFVVNVAELAAESGCAAMGGASDNPPRVAPRESTWAALEEAKKVLADAKPASSQSFKPPPRRRRKQPDAPVAQPSQGSKVKQGTLDVESELGTVKWTVLDLKDETLAFIEAEVELSEETQLSLHWGAAPHAGSEWEPPSHTPAGASNFDPVAMRSLLQGQARLELRWPVSKAPQWMSFVLFAKTGGGEAWIKQSDGNNFWIPVKATATDVPSGGPSSHGGGKKTVGENFCGAETHYKNWTHFQRICMVSDVLGGKVGREEAAWLAADLSLADAKALEWYRNAGYQPKDMAHAQERVGGALCNAVEKASDPVIRTLLRLCAKAIPRGNAKGGDSIRHGILNIMRNHGIKEGHRPGIECKFIEQWHQKLHTNSAPDDIAICEGYLAFLQSGNPDDMWRVIWEVGKLTREDLGKMCSQGFADHTKSGAKGLNFTPRHLPHMYNDVRDFLGLLKHVHGGTDLFSLCEACKGQYPDHGTEILAFDIFNGRDDPYSMGKILDMRRRLKPCLGKRDVLMLDVAMEDLFRSLAERTNVGNVGRDDLGNMVLLMLEELMLSREDPSLQLGVQLLQRLLQGDHGGQERWSAEWCKMVHAACDRLGLTCAASADQMAELLQGCADKLNESGKKPGAVFQPDSKMLDTFGEEKARCLSERVVAQFLKHLMPQLRRAAGLGPWEVVSTGQGGGASGTIQAMASLPMDLAEGQAPVIAVVQTMTGWEDIPAGITAVLLPAGQAVDTLSHVAIRARNQQVLLASCDEEDKLESLRKNSGAFVRVQVSASGDVTWKGAEKNNAGPTATAGKATPQLKVPAPPEPPKVILPISEFTKHSKCLGGKSLHLAELQPKDGAYSIPVSATVPYRSFEKALGFKPNEGIKEELDEILESGDLAEARKFVVDELAVPPEIEAELTKALAAQGAPALKGSWQQALKGVWASKWTDRAVSSRKQMSVPDDALFLAVLVQPIVPAAYAFVIHTQSPLPGAKAGDQLVELCVGLGESLVSNSPGRALSATVASDGTCTVHVYPSKPDGVFAPEGGTLIFRSDSNGEDLEGFAGAGLYDSITVESCLHRQVGYADEALLFDVSFREKLLKSLYQLGRQVQANFNGSPQDIEGAVHANGKIVVTQSRPQV